MNIFKKTFFASVLIAFLCQSCGILDQPSPNDIDVETAFKTAKNAEDALIGLYASMQNRNYYGGNYVLLSEALTDNGSTGGYDNNALDEFGTRQLTSSNIYIEKLWIACYFTIANANFLLAGLEKITDSNLTARRKAEIQGQARAIRALAHFDLLRYFGEHWDTNSDKGIPIINKIQGIKDLAGRNTVGETYTFVLSELLAAESLVDDTNRDKNFMNLLAIRALLARVYLYQKDMNKAFYYADITINDGSSTLLDSLSFGTVYSKYNTNEEIFNLQFDSQNRSGYNGFTYSRNDALRSEILFLTSENLKLFFEARPNDLRTNLLDYANNDESIAPDGRTQKYRGEDKQDNPAYIIRLAEVFLIRAEARGRSFGINDVNQVRAARGMAAFLQSDLPTEADFIEAVMQERRAELNMEGHRYFDLARTQKYAGVLQTDAFRAILPIPLREITATNGLIKQNQGY